ncbi:MAG: hypothetical protein ABSG17_11425 [Spirochaetia bacterium]|jgi:hypothetical protein
MLHDPGSYAPPLSIRDITLGQQEKDVLRKLAEELTVIASLPAQAEKTELWRRLNDLQSSRPMVWINEIPWHEMNVDDELTLRTFHPWARELETRLRRTLYQARHMPADMVVSDFIECPLAIHSTDFGIVEDVDIARTDAASDIYSRRFRIQIREPRDIEKIRMPVVTHDEETTAVVHDAMVRLFSDIMPVRRVGQTHIWFAPWDYLIRWWGVEEAMVDLVERPEMVNAAVERLVDAWMTELDQFVALNLLSLDCSNTRIGSGGFGYASGLPGEPYDPARVLPLNMWGCSNAQIFAEVSPEMHWELALRHDLRWLARWKLTYYGCCEPLDRKIELLRRIPNLRKISMSPWNDFTRAIREIGDRYVFSFKPSPAIFAEEAWNPERARASLTTVLDRARRECHVEIIMKDISTVRRDPRRLWDWARIAMEVAQEGSHP